jgi:glycosyltransferase involved in cell wall biosynthesis
MVWQLLMGFHGLVNVTLPADTLPRKTYDSFIHTLQDMVQAKKGRPGRSSSSAATFEARAFKLSAIKHPSCVYVASKDHWPNEVGASFILENLSLKMPHVQFLIVGTSNIRSPGQYQNVVFTGYIDNLDDVLRKCDVGINPMLAGAGTNLKMLAYAAAGLPIVSTHIGARGVLDIGGVFTCDIFEFSKTLKGVLKDVRQGRIKRVKIPEKYLWNRIVQNLDIELDRIICTKGM